MNPTPLTQRIFILAGGKGTRLQSAVPATAKILAPVLERTFLDYLLDHLYSLGFRKYVFLLGYRCKEVQAHLQKVRTRYEDIEIETSVEEIAAGTAGALKIAEKFCNDTFFLINGDTYYGFDPLDLLRAHKQSQAMITMASLHIEDTSRYGTLDTAKNGRVIAFREKEGQPKQGIISAGVYVVDSRLLEFIPFNKEVSIEHETFPQLLAAGEKIQAVRQQGTFFDIGTPASYSHFEDFLSKLSHD